MRFSLALVRFTAVVLVVLLFLFLFCFACLFVGANVRLCAATKPRNRGFMFEL
jgi:hypothetical protein